MCGIHRERLHQPLDPLEDLVELPLLCADCPRASWLDRMSFSSSSAADELSPALAGKPLDALELDKMLPVVAEVSLAGCPGRDVHSSGRCQRYGQGQILGDQCSTTGKEASNE